MHDLGSCKAEVFDAWISEFFEEIINVDREVWDLHQRWQIVNEVLAAGLLTLHDNVLEIVVVEVS